LPNFKRSKGAKTIRVLHVDDDPSILEISKSILELEGNFEVEDAQSVDEALKKLSIAHYDVVVSDYEIPQKDGLQFLTELREAKNEIPFILFALKGKEETAKKALNLGANGYINKQGNPETVYGELEHVIQQKVEHKKAELIVFEAAAYAQNIMATMRESLLVLDENLKVISANDSFYKTFEVTSKETEGNCIFDLGNSQWDIPILHELIDKINSDQSFFSDFEVEHVFPKIGRKIMLLNARQMLQRVKGANLILVTFEDITERKKAEELAVARLNRYQSFIDVTGELGWTTNAAGEVLEDIPSFRDFTGQTYDEVKGWGWLKAVHPEDAPSAKLAWQTAVANKTNYEVEYRLRRFDGVYRNFMTRSAPIFNDGKIFEWVGTCIDITERKKVEETLLKSEHLLSESERIGKVGGWKINIDTNKLTWTNETYRIHEVDQNFTPTVQKGISFYTPESRIIIEQAVEQAIAHGKPFNLELQIATAKGNIRSIRAIGEPNLPNREVQGFFQDITERKKAEEALRSVAENLKRSNLELEQFAYVASHDLQEPLRMVTSYTQLLEQRYKGKLDADADEFIKYAVDGANRMRSLIDDLLSYSRVNRRGNPFRPTESELALDVAIKNLQMSIEENGVVVTHDQLPEVMADEGQLVQLLQNLIGNAIKFHAKEPPCVHVSAKNLQEKEYLFSVQDNGIGIDPQYFDRLFKIFQRLHTKEEYPGTGIGLALCKRIVERHGGSIWLESQPGKGTTIYFTLNNKKGEKQKI
jgi:PAS domain S-box-containing protein